jgi:D-sedoheptulose 7-phosphate isomerase
MKYRYLDELTERRPELAGARRELERACAAIVGAYRNGGKVLVCGNGGSAADADHIVGELMKGFLKKRPLPSELKRRFEATGGADGAELAEKLQTPLRAINLCAMTALNTAFANDVSSDYVYAQQALAFTDKGDIFIGVSTSGSARNVHAAAIAAKTLGATLIALTGADGGLMNGLYDILIKAPECVTYKIQEAHIALYHAVCLTVEDEIFRERT